MPLDMAIATVSPACTPQAASAPAQRRACSAGWAWVSERVPWMRAMAWGVRSAVVKKPWCSNPCGTGCAVSLMRERTSPCGAGMGAQAVWPRGGVAHEPADLCDIGVEQRIDQAVREERVVAVPLQADRRAVLERQVVDPALGRLGGN